MAPLGRRAHLARQSVPLGPLSILIVLLVALACGLAPTGAVYADAPNTQSSPVTDAVPDELQQRVEETAIAYNEAVSHREEIEQQIADCEARIAEIQAQLPAAREQAADALYFLYRFQQNDQGLLELLLCAEDFNGFISTIQYLNSVSRHSTGQLEELNALVSELDRQNAELADALAAAQEQEAVASAALAEAQAAREEARRRAEEERRRAAEEAARVAQQQTQGNAGAAAGTSDDPAADQSAPQGSDDAVSDDGGSGGESAEDGNENVDWTSDRDAFISEWGARIDAYLAGFPLAGYGATFAAAAWDYGVNPRWSPAIAFAESTLGTYCFLPHNAWGWGSVSWGSWEEAIYDHVAGLARGYGYTLTYDAALKYCPPNADYWYSVVSQQMSYI